MRAAWSTMIQRREESPANQVAPRTWTAPRMSTMLDDISPFSRHAESHHSPFWRWFPPSRKQLLLWARPARKATRESQRPHPSECLHWRVFQIDPLSHRAVISIGPQQIKVMPAESGTLAPSRRQSPKHRNSGFLGQRPSGLNLFLLTLHSYSIDFGQQRPSPPSMRWTDSAVGLGMCNVQPNERADASLFFPSP